MSPNYSSPTTRVPPCSPSWCGQAPSIGWGSLYKGRWQPKRTQFPCSGARTPGNSGGMAQMPRNWGGLG